jgi:hypothetical protein
LRPFCFVSSLSPCLFAIPCCQLVCITGGFLPSRDPVKLYRFKTYYSPHLNSTLLSEGDLHAGLGFPAREYSGVSHHHHYLTGTWTAIAHHKQAPDKNVELCGVVRCGKKLTHPIIRPKAADEPMDLGNRTDRQFGLAAEKTIESIASASVISPTTCRPFPLEQYTTHVREVLSIRAATERLLWHQRLGHPSDFYLYRAHEHIDGVPKFKHFDPILEQCLTCIRSNTLETN